MELPNEIWMRIFMVTEEPVTFTQICKRFENMISKYNVIYWLNKNRKRKYNTLSYCISILNGDITQTNRLMYKYSFYPRKLIQLSKFHFEKNIHNLSPHTILILRNLAIEGNLSANKRILFLLEYNAPIFLINMSYKSFSGVAHQISKLPLNVFIEKFKNTSSYFFKDELTINIKIVRFFIELLFKKKGLDSIKYIIHFSPKSMFRFCIPMLLQLKTLHPLDNYKSRYLISMLNWYYCEKQIIAQHEIQQYVSIQEIIKDDEKQLIKLCLILYKWGKYECIFSLPKIQTLIPLKKPINALHLID